MPRITEQSDASNRTRNIPVLLVINMWVWARFRGSYGEFCTGGYTTAAVMDEVEKFRNISSVEKNIALQSFC